MTRFASRWKPGDHLHIEGGSLAVGPVEGGWDIVSEGSTTPGGHVTAVAGSDGRIALFVADRNGAVYKGDGDFHDLLRSARYMFFE